MNSNQLYFTQMIDAMLDADWRERIDDQIDATPETMDFCTPEAVGRLDAEEQLECDPTRHGYRTVLECEAYILGFKDVTGAMDLEDARDDVEFWRRGGW